MGENFLAPSNGTGWCLIILNPIYAYDGHVSGTVFKIRFESRLMSLIHINIHPLLYGRGVSYELDASLGLMSSIALPPTARLV